MIWLRRLVLLPLLGAIAVLTGWFSGTNNLPELSLQNGLILAAVVAVALFVAFRLLAAFALAASLFLGLLFFAAVILISSLVFMEAQRDQWLDNQADFPVALNQQESTIIYLRSHGIEPDELPPLDWLRHAAYQADSALQSQQLKANEIGVPKDRQKPADVWENWFSQLLALMLGTLLGCLGARRNNS